MKLLWKALLALLFIVANYYAVKFTFVGLNHPSDAAFVGGLLGGLILLVIDLEIARRVIQHYVAKMEETLCPQENQDPQTSTTTSPQPQSNHNQKTNQGAV
jgi:hypothetical protein